MKNIVNCESDELIYGASFSAQKVGQKVTFKTGATIDLGNDFTATSLKKYYKEQGFLHEIDYTFEPYLILDEPNIVILNLNTMIRKLWMLHTHKDASVYNVATIKQVNLWLSPSDGSNFRFAAAKTPGPKGNAYKAGRADKPYYYKLARQYIIDMYGAKEIAGKEADDALSMYQTDETILCSKDKDLNMVPGLRYNPGTDELYEISEFGGPGLDINGKERCTGLFSFYQQLLTGDATDNIPACRNFMKSKYKKPPAFTMKTAINYLKTCKTEKELLRLVIEAYKLHYGGNWRDVLLEMADLLWMCRNEKETGGDYIIKLLGDIS